MKLCCYDNQPLYLWHKLKLRMVTFYRENDIVVSVACGYYSWQNFFLNSFCLLPLKSDLVHPFYFRKQDVELVAAPNGTVYLLYSDSRKVIWSFPSGPPIYSSYQAPIQQDSEKDTTVGPGRHSFVDCGDDWALYLNKQYGKLACSIFYLSFKLLHVMLLF